MFSSKHILLKDNNIPSSTANATLFLISSFKYVNNMKTFACDCHLNDPTTFQHHQIQVCFAHARMLALGYTNAFSVLHVRGLVIFQNRAQIRNLQILPDEFMETEMSKFTTQRR